MQNNLPADWWLGVGDSLQVIGSGTLAFLPKFIAALAIVILGWAIGALFARVISQIIKSLRLDKVLQGAGVEDIVVRAGFHLDSGAFVGGLVKWFIMIVFLVAAFDVLGLQQVNKFLSTVVLGYLPQVIVAVLILLIGAVLSDSMQKIVVGSAKAAEVKSANFLGGVTKWAIWIFAILIALSQLGIASQFMFTLFTGVVAMLALAGGLAFGLGGRDAAEKYLERLRRDISSHKD